MICRGLAAGLVALSVAGCGPAYDAPTLAEAVGPTFAHLYARAQTQVGRTDVTAVGIGATTTCQRGGGDTLDEGPGDDWTCLVSYVDPSTGPKQVLYEVVLKPEGCYSADGPPPVVGDARVPDAQGVLRLNPIYAFDGCL